MDFTSSSGQASTEHQRSTDPEINLLATKKKESSKISVLRNEIGRVFFSGGSSFDAWLITTTSQVAQVLLTLPYSFAQTGMVPGILNQLVYGFLGCWSCYMTTSLYSDYVQILERQNSRRHDHIIQWYEILGCLMGRWWRLTALVLNCALLLCASTIQLIACGSTVWYINNNLDKRTWTYIFGACCCLTIFIPTARNYRLWTFIGIFMTTYTAWFMTIFAALHDRVDNAKHTGAQGSVQYFTGATNSLYLFGGHGITLEIMDAMHKPENFKTVFFWATLYIFTLTLPSAITVYWRFGDVMLHNPNAFAVFPPSGFRNAAVALMLAHQFIEYGILALPVFVMWEKFLGIHDSSKPYLLKSISRLPIVLLTWFIAIMFPFFGPINSVVGSYISSIVVYIMPCIAIMVLRRNPESRKKATDQPPRWLPSWVYIYCINLGLVLWVAIMGVGFGGWASIMTLRDKIDTFGLFARCYQCKH